MEKRISDLQTEDFDYIDNDLFIIEQTDKLPHQLLGEVLDMELLLFCKRGKASFRLDQTPMKIEEGQCALCPEYVPIYDLMVSTDLSLYIVGFSWHLLEDIPALEKNAWLVTGDFLREPFFSPNKTQREHISRYLQLIAHHAQNQESRFCNEIIHLLCQTLIFEILNMTCAEREDMSAYTSNAGIAQSVLLSRQFFEILSHGDGAIRSVAEVAKAMTISPKYLSRVIRAKTGHPPLYHIHQYTVRAIERQLKYSDKTIKEISACMGFPSLAFFGKFVKDHLGVSPKDYRAKMIAEKNSDLREI